jgi:hypothetical protein
MTSITLRWPDGKARWLAVPGKRPGRQPSWRRNKDGSVTATYTRAELEVALLVMAATKEAEETLVVSVPDRL